MSETGPFPWLTLIGLGEDGLSGLSDASRCALDKAEVIFGGPRHLDLVDAGVRGQAWPVPFSTAPVLAKRGRPVVVLASGDPFHFGAGGSLMRDLAPGDWVSHPAPSCFSLATNHLGWKIEDCLCLGLHAAPYAGLRPVLGLGVRVICTLRDHKAPAELADWLVEQGYGSAHLHILERLGGPKAHVTSSLARDYVPTTGGGAPVLAAIEATTPGLPRTSGLPDDLFTHGGQITKRPIRAITLSTLAPRVGDVLWDIGGGSGSISIEWCLAAPSATAVTFESRQDRLDGIKTNIDRFGLNHRITSILGRAPDILIDTPAHRLSRPDAVFIGGGASQDLLDHLWGTIPIGTRIVANAVTLETETLLMQAHARWGGHLLKAEISEVNALGSLRGWHSARPVLQWSITR